MAKYIIFDPLLCTRDDLESKGVPSNHMCILKHVNKEDGIMITPGNSYLMVGESCFKYVNEHYHLGLRKTTFYQACDIPKITTRDGINFTFVPKVIGTTKFDPRLKFFLSPEFNKHLKELPEENKIITKDLRVGIEWMRNWLDGKWKEPDPWNGWFGLDYETASVHPDGHKEICGVGISSISRGIFIDFRFPKNQEEWNEFSGVYKEFCLKYCDHIFAYNTKFEFDRTNETFGFYADFQDAGAFNIVDGRQKIYYSLKYTAQYDMGVSSWDDDFDEFAHYLKNDIFKNYKNLDALKADTEKFKRFKSHFIDEDDYQEWEQILAMKPHYWGDQFWNQTSRNLGKYCILDAYHTLMIAVTQWNKYPEVANVFTLDNLRLGQQLMATGCFLDNAKRDHLRKINWKYQAYALFKLNSAVCILKTSEVDSALMNRLSDRCKILIQAGLNPAVGPDFWKAIAPKIIDKNSESFLDEYKTEVLLGTEVANKLINFHRRYGKSFENFTHSKKMKEDLYRYRHMLYTDEDKEILTKYSAEFSKIRSNEVYAKRLKMLKESELWDLNFDEVSHEDEFMIGGKKRNFEQICKIFNCSKGNNGGWYKWGSPKPLKKMKQFFLNIMGGFPTAFTINMYTKLKYMKLQFGEELVKDPKALYPVWKAAMEKYEGDVYKLYRDHEYIDREEILHPTPEDCMYRLYPIGNMKRLLRHAEEFNDGLYPNEKHPFEFRLTSKYKDGEYDILKDACHSGFGRWSTVYPDIKARTNKFGFEYDPETPFEIITTCLKCFYMFSAYNKEMQYLDGVFSEGRERVKIIDKDLRFVKDQSGDYTHINTNFKICRLKTKRNSSGFHTIPHATAIKGIIKAPDGYAMSYFDVSQAEPRTCAYLIEKDKMRDCYESGQDLYYLTAAIMHGQTYEEFTARKDAKQFRSNFKTCLLGLLYGMGAETLGGRIGADEETAKEYIDALFKTFPKLKPAIDKFKQYPLKHNRECLTFWGDRLVSEPCDDGSLMRHGINYPVQGNTSLALTAGFMHVIQECEKANLNIRPVLAIHDALVNYFPVDQLWELNKFYFHNFTTYLYNICGVKYKFSVNYGTDYFNMCEITNIDDDNIILDGSNTAIKQLMDRLDSVGFKYEIVSQESDLTPICQITMKKYNGYYAEQAAYDEDTSHNKVVLKRISKSNYNIPTYE